MPKSTQGRSNDRPSKPTPVAASAQPVTAPPPMTDLEDP